MKKWPFFFFPSEKMSPHFKLRMETFSNFARCVYFLVLTFYQVSKIGDQKLIWNLEAVGWIVYRVSEILAHILKGVNKFCNETIVTKWMHSWQRVPNPS